MSAAVATSLLVAALHVGFFYLEAVLWATPTGQRVFGQSAEQAQATRVLAMNQGFYNLGVAALLGWAALAPNEGAAVALLAFLVAMGVVGGLTASRSILALQAAPAAVALGLWFL